MSKWLIITYFIIVYLKNYDMTKPLGRALIISNEYKVIDSRTGTAHWRRGAEFDYDNIRLMFDRLNFVTTGGHKNYTAKVFVVPYRE